jgi:16S rRNA (cytidine1402-2'-O)-methyltransferase
MTDLYEVLGDRRAALCRELTKLHEEVIRGPLSELVASLRRAPVKGEIVLVVEGARTDTVVDLEGAVEEVLTRVGSGESVREATRHVAAERGVSRRPLYDRVLQRRDEQR